ncbi:MAG: integrase core domain-containing protein [Rudaea sp.]|nr:integrase core domain-containing protein [Rudaea sp.]
MFKHAIARHSLPTHVSTDHDPLFRFHRWRANLRVLKIEEIKSIPYTPVPYPFVERLIGTIPREHFDQTLFWNSLDLSRKLEEFKNYYNNSRVHQSLCSATPTERSGKPLPVRAAFDSFGSKNHSRGLFQTPVAD